MLKLYNTLTRKKEIFKPIKKDKVSLFVCGLTPYDYAHIGHAKTYIQFDMIARYLKYSKFKLFYLQNVTDIDDKIIERANKENKNPLTLSHEFEEFYKEDMNKLKVNSVNKYAKATNYINEIVSQVERLIKKGYAYKASDGYYFDLSKFKNYGKLSGRKTIRGEDSISRIDDNKDKKNKGDFCLWKFSKKNELSWNTKFGSGRPGWHIEDTAITEKELGPQYDIHGGARDLIFPHHEAEIAQMESITNKPLVKYWMHTGFLTVNSQKMSKSLNNFITIKDALKKYSPEEIRMFILSTHYRSPINFDEKNLKQARSNIERISNFLLSLENKKTTKENKKIINLVKKFHENFIKSMDDDFNTPKALASLFILINKINRIAENGISKRDASLVIKEIKEVNKIFDILKSEERIPKEIIELAKKREIYRKQKNFIEADKIRKQIENKKYTIEDSDSGFILKSI